jgi:glycosyltransferase involved in cell wall biosynthesis
MAIAMSRYGFDRLTELSDGFRSIGRAPFQVRYAPHAVDDIYRPVETDFREIIDVPEDAFLVGIVAANNGTGIYDRKGFGDMAAALAQFMNRHSDAYVYLHTIQAGQGLMDLPALFAFKRAPDDRIRWADQYMLRKHSITDANMAQIYSSFNVLLATSRGEGFGIPVIEAQACGVPVIASNWTAQAELVGDVWTPDYIGSDKTPSGWLVGVDPDYDPRQIGDWGKPRIPQIIAALEDAYATRGDPALKEAAIAKAEPYRADTVFDTYWRPILSEMEDALHPVQPNREQRRAARRAKVA